MCRSSLRMSVATTQKRRGSCREPRGATRGANWCQESRVEPVNHAGAPEKPLVSAYESEEEVSPKAGVADRILPGLQLITPGRSRVGTPASHRRDHRPGHQSAPGPQQQFEPSHLVVQTDLIAGGVLTSVRCSHASGRRSGWRRTRGRSARCRTSARTIHRGWRRRARRPRRRTAPAVCPRRSTRSR